MGCRPKDYSCCLVHDREFLLLFLHLLIHKGEYKETLKVIFVCNFENDKNSTKYIYPKLVHLNFIIS